LSFQSYIEQSNAPDWLKSDFFWDILGKNKSVFISLFSLRRNAPQDSF
jgi:hypothetical protein